MTDICTAEWIPSGLVEPFSNKSRNKYVVVVNLVMPEVMS
jgi:hypothetical protein